MIRNIGAGRQVGRWLRLAMVAGLCVANADLVAPSYAQQEMPFITVTITENKFTPNSIPLTLGQQVLLNIQNAGASDHSLLSDIPLSQVHYIKADNTRQELSSYEATNVLNADAVSGHTSMVTLTPSKPGTFEFFSEDEEDLGLTGDFVVSLPGAQAATARAAAGPAPMAPAARATVANDGQTLAGQSAATQSMFRAVWGDRADTEWVTEHNAAAIRR
jgi:hypothetical protein